MNEQIIVGYDGTTPSAEAVRWAANEAVVRGTTLRIISCYEVPALGEVVSGWAASEAIEAVIGATASRLKSITDSVAIEHPSLMIAPEVSAGPPAIVLMEAAGDHDAASHIIVLGASKHSGAGAFWLGSTPRQVVRRSHCPVAVVRSLTGSIAPARVVAGVDGSPSATEAVRWAAAEADRYGVPLAIVHAWSYPYAPVDTGSAQARDLTEIDAACVLERAVEAARDLCGVDVAGVLVESSPAAGLLDSVRDGDLLVVGARRAGVVRAGLFGSTVNVVLDNAVVPVVVVPEHVGAESR